MKIFIAIFLLTFSQVLFAQANKNILKKHPKDVQKIILTENGAFRGFNFGETRENIKAKESLQLHSESDSILLYTLYLDKDDSADLLYYFDKNEKATSFAIVFILGDRNEEQFLRKDLTKFYIEKYGMYSVINEEDEIWDTKQGHSIEMRDTSDESGIEIEIAYYKTVN